MGENAVHDGNAGGAIPGVQSFVQSPLLFDMFANVCTGLTVKRDEIDTSEIGSDVLTHFFN